MILFIFSFVDEIKTLLADKVLYFPQFVIYAKRDIFIYLKQVRHYNLAIKPSQDI